jgi:multisubunit Na+/H+ antiporter MnhB subunit
MSSEGRLARRRKQGGAEIGVATSIFRDSLWKAGALDQAEQGRAEELLARFAGLRELAGRESGEALENARDEARRLSRCRAYFLPQAEVRLEGRDAFAEMQQWSVPAPALANVREVVEKQVLGDDLPAARSALNTVLDSYHFWDDYIDWYFAQIDRAVAVGVALTLVTLICSLALLARGAPILGFILAGATGASTSILLKLPPLTVYGEAASLWPRSAVRYVAGTVAAAVGCGLLVTDVVNIPNMEGMTPSRAIDACAGAPLPAVPEATARLLAAARPAGPAGETAAARPDQPGQPGPPASAGAGSPAADPQAGARPAAAGKASGPAGCSRRWLTVLFSIGMLFGFSERALARFEETIFRVGSRKPT